jgi:hypothetical protein
MEKTALAAKEVTLELDSACISCRRSFFTKSLKKQMGMLNVEVTTLFRGQNCAASFLTSKTSAYKMLALTPKSLTVLATEWLDSTAKLTASC